jgi:hypothetical protein
VDLAVGYESVSTSGGTHTLERGETVTREKFDQQVEEKVSDDDIDYSGWFCIATDPFECPAAGCSFVANHVTAAHLIVVWPSNDDSKLLNAALRCREAGRNPKVVEYEKSLGPCISWDRWVSIGRPIHAQRPEPDGWSEIPKI